MRKDPTKFRERFKRWKEGKQVYEAGLPKYEDGKLPKYSPLIDDYEAPEYKSYLKKLAVARRNAFLKEYGHSPSVDEFYNSFLSNDNGSFNYRRWYNLASPEEREWGLKKGLAHWSDASGKTSLHPTFSIESPYSGYINPYNPKGIVGGTWLNTGDPHNERYEFSDSQMDNEWPINKTLEEFQWARKFEDTNPYAMYKGGYVLPEITVIGKRKTGRYENGRPLPAYGNGKPIRKGTSSIEPDLSVDIINTPDFDWGDMDDPIYDTTPEETVLKVNEKIREEDLSKMPPTYKPHTLDDTINAAKYFYANDVWKRFEKSIGGTLPSSRFWYVMNNPIISYDKDVSGDSPGIYIYNPYDREGNESRPSIGLYRDYNPTLKDKDYTGMKREAQTLSHEFMHNWVKHFPTTSEEQSLLDEAFPLRPYYKNNKKKNYSEEQRTSNTESRFGISADNTKLDSFFVGQNLPAGKELDELIDKLSVDEILERGVPNDYIQPLERPENSTDEEWNAMKKKRADAIVKAWKTIAFNDNNQLLDTLYAKNGKMPLRIPKFGDGNKPYIRSTIEDAALKAAKASGNYVPDPMNKYPYQKDLHTPLSPVDPVGEFTVGNAVLGTPLKLAGKALMYGVGRYGGKLGLNKLSNWARAKLISGAMDDVVAKGTIPTKNTVNASIDYSSPDEVDEISRELATKVLMKSAKEQEGFGMSAVGKDKLFSEDVSNIIYNTVLPRMQLMRPGYRGGLLFPTVKSRVASAVDRGYTEYPEWLFDRYSKTTQGIHFPETGHIAIRKGQLGFAGPHEIRHRIDDGGLSLTETEDEILRSAYGDDFVNLSKLIDRFKNMNLYKERATTNLDARTRLLEENGLIDAPLESQNALIDAIGDDRLFDYIASANGYGWEYINYLRNNNLLTAKKADAFRKSMKYVGASAAPLGFYNLYREK